MHTHTHTHSHALRYIHVRLQDSTSGCGNAVARTQHIYAKYFARYPDFLANAKAHVEKLPSVPREVWLLALRARVVLVANLPLALFSIKTVEITASRISVCMRDLCAALAVHLGQICWVRATALPHPLALSRDLNKLILSLWAIDTVRSLLQRKFFPQEGSSTWIQLLPQVSYYTNTVSISTYQHTKPFPMWEASSGKLYALRNYYRGLPHIIINPTSQFLL